MRTPLVLSIAALSALALLASCSQSDPEAKARLAARQAGPSPEAVRPTAPEAALALSADDAAKALGPFEWTAAVEWSVVRAGADAAQVRATERHALRQDPAGEFAVLAELDPGEGPGSVSGKEIVFADGMTYARALPAPFRERPTDRGRDARRFRDESFAMGRSLLALYGPALRIEPAGETTLLGRPARRYRLALAASGGVSPVAAAGGGEAADPAEATTAAGARDADTALRQAFLRGRIPRSADGELVTDAATGAPLRLRLSGAFGVEGQPEVTASVELLAQVSSVGKIRPIAAPKRALPDERKPAGPSTALEAAGLKKRGEQKAAAAAEPADEPE